MRRHNKFFNCLFSLCARGWVSFPIPLLFFLQSSSAPTTTRDDDDHSMSFALSPDTPRFYRKKKITTTMANETSILFLCPLPLPSHLSTRLTPSPAGNRQTDRHLSSAHHNLYTLWIDNTEREEEDQNLSNKNHYIKMWRDSSPSPIRPFHCFHSTSPI